MYCIFTARAHSEDEEGGEEWAGGKWKGCKCTVSVLLVHTVRRCVTGCFAVYCCMVMHVCVCAHLVLDDGMDEVLLRYVVVNVLRSAGRVRPGR